MTSLLDTTDYRAWIDAALVSRKKTRKDLASAVGRSPAWATQVLAGERALDPELVDPLAAFLRLDAQETSYLSALLDLDARSPRARRAAWATVQATWRHRASPNLNEEYFRHISLWYVGAVLELATCEGFRPDPGWISRTLVPAITPAEAQEALTTLVRLGMLVPDETRGLVRAEVQVVTPMELSAGAVSEALIAYHRSYLQIAAESLSWARHNERRITHLTMGLTEEVVPKVLSRLVEMEQELVQLSLDQTGTPNRIYSFALQFVPTSHYTDSTHLDGE